MPWAVWAVATVVVSMWIPLVGFWVAYVVVIFTLLATHTLPAMIGEMFTIGKSDINGRIAITQFVRSDGPAPRGWDYLWGLVGWTGVVWLAAVVVLGLWIAIKLRAGQSVRGVTNLLILVVGWPVCFWLAMHVVSTTASS
ncbi:MAG: hypothetical protein ACLPGW_11775 [Roseiarcus sp.]